ncbi:MAG: mechanosensitive ion channel family protein [Lachnospiraceae bacterium]
MFDRIPWKVIIIIISFLVVYIFVDEIFKRIERKQKDIHIQFSKKLIRAALVILGLAAVAAQYTTTQQLTTYLVAGSSLFVAIAGFAAQQTLADVIAGFMLSWSKPYNINERITLINSNITGIVEEITMRHTVIKLFDNNRLIIPNSVMNKEIIKNSNYEDSKIGNFIEVEISFETDVDRAICIMKEILCAEELFVDKENADVLIKDFSANGIVLKTTVWTENVNDNFQACSNVRRQILKRFHESGIVITYPHIIVWDQASTPVKTAEVGE